LLLFSIPLTCVEPLVMSIASTLDSQYAFLKGAVQLRQENREVQFGQEGVETDQMKCHKSST
jgi:hypothetical protein